MKCKMCGREVDIYKDGYCEACCEKISDLIKASNDALRQALAESKKPGVNKDSVITLTENACRALDKLARDRVTLYKGGHNYIADEIYKNLGVKRKPAGPAAAANPLRAWVIALTLAFVAMTLLFANTLFHLRDANALNRDLAAQVQQLSASAADLEARLESYEKTASTKKTVTLENGNFAAGTDFAAGTYDIEAVSGAGNVFSDNLDGGINAMMATQSENYGGFYEQKYSNIKLPEGTTLTVQDVKIRLRLVEAY